MQEPSSRSFRQNVPAHSGNSGHQNRVHHCPAVTTQTFPSTTSRSGHLFGGLNSSMGCKRSKSSIVAPLELQKQHLSMSVSKWAKQGKKTQKCTIPGRLTSTSNFLSNCPTVNKMPFDNVSTKKSIVCGRSLPLFSRVVALRPSIMVSCCRGIPLLWGFVCTHICTSPGGSNCSARLNNALCSTCHRSMPSPRVGLLSHVMWPDKLFVHLIQ